MGETGSHGMVSEGLLYPDREDQMRRSRIQRGGSSGPGGTLQSYSVSCELPCGPCCSLDPGTVVCITLLCGLHPCSALGAGSCVWNRVWSQQQLALGAALEGR